MNRAPPPSAVILREALSLHQSGNLEEARKRYRSVLKIDRRNADAYHLLGVLEAQNGAHLSAAELIGKAIALEPNNAAFHYNRGAALQALGRLEEALRTYDKALALKPDVAEVYNNRGNVLQALNRSAEALSSYDKSLQLNARNPLAHNNRGNALQALERYPEAVESYNKALTLKPDYALALFRRGDALRAVGQFAAAVASYDKAIGLRPHDSEAYNNRGLALRELKRGAQALADFETALALKPDYAAAHHNRGYILQAAGRLEDAIASYGNALQFHPDSVETLVNLGNALHALGRFDEAVARFDQALVLRPDSAEAYADRGLSLQELKRFEEAVAAYDKALALAPHFAETWNNRGVALQALKRFDEALESYGKVLALKPDDANAHNNLGNALQELRRLEEALASYDSALAHAPQNAKALGNRGAVLRELGRIDESYETYKLALALQTDLDFLFGTYLYTKMGLCDWTSFEDDLAVLRAGIASHHHVTPPFPTIGALDDPKLQRAAAEIWVGAKHPRPTSDVLFSTEAHTKIRVGYYSADFQNHATTQLMAQLFEEHSREHFEFYGFSFGPSAEDAMRQRVAAAFDEFIDIRTRSDREVAELSRRMGIDIAVDLKGFTKDSRPGMFVERCAPIQVNYLGYPGTVGATFLDYIIADRILIPPDARENFSEKVVYLPGSYQPNDAKRRISDRIFTRTELGLPETGFVFCCFNNPFKITPSTFDSWTRILKGVDGSVLWLLRDSPTVEINLRKAAAARGVDDRRLVFAERIPTDEHLARQRLADLFLDTLPCNAHTTASDALWAGLPVLTQIGETFAGRVAASLLHALGLPELVTDTSVAYEAMAIDIANRPGLADAIKTKLAQNRATAPLFDARTLARHIEAAYQAMYARYRAGFAPEVIEIKTTDR